MRKCVRVMCLCVSVLFLFTTLLTGCGNSSQTSSNAKAGAPAENTAGTQPASSSAPQKPSIGSNLKYDPNVPVNGGKEITLTFWTQVDQEQIYKRWFEDYSKIHPNVKIELVSSSYEDHFKKLPIALQSGTGPDFFHVHNSFNDVLVPNAEPYPADVFPMDQLKADFRQVDEHVQNGKLYYIDVGIMTSGIFYNKKMWAEAGLTDNDIPKTWDAFREIAKKLTKADASGKITRAGFDMNGAVTNMLEALNLQKGQRLFGEDGKTPVIDTQITKDNMKMLADMYNTDKVCNNKFPITQEALGKEQAAMIYSWGWVANYMLNNFPKVEFGFFPLPTFDGNPPPAYDRNNGESSMGVNKNAPEDHKKAAFDVIKFFLASDDYMADLDVKFAIAPSKYSLDSNSKITSNPTVSACAKILDRTIWPGAYPDAYEKTITQYLADEVMVKNTPIDAAVAKTAEKEKEAMASTSFVSVESKYKFASQFSK